MRNQLSDYGLERDLFKAAKPIERELEKKLGIDDALYVDILKIYDVCDHSRFAGGKGDAENKIKAIAVIQKTVQKMEKICR